MNSMSQNNLSVITPGIYGASMKSEIPAAIAKRKFGPKPDSGHFSQVILSITNHLTTIILIFLEGN